MARHRLDEHFCQRTGLGTDELTPTAIREWQLAKLRDLVRHAKINSPFYARHLQQVEASALRTPQDFSTLPFISGHELRESPEQLLCVSQDEIARVITLQSSGTTGEPKRIFHTQDDLSATRHFFSDGMSHLVNTGETALVLMPGERPDGVGRLLAEALKASGARAITHGILEHAENAIAQLLGYDIRCIVGSPAHVNTIAKEWKARQLPTDQIKSVLLCWDAIPSAVVKNAKDAFGCEVFRHWGMIETGLGGAVECESHKGMHLRESDVYLEIVDPQTLHPLPDGERGEIVISSLLKLGMPLIRYRTGDEGRIVPGVCSCGSPLRRLDARILRLQHEKGEGGQPIRLHDLNESLYAVQNLADFVAHFSGNVLHITATGDTDLRRDDILKALKSIDAIRPTIENKTLHVMTRVRHCGAPAVPGLGKRKIQHKS